MTQADAPGDDAFAAITADPVLARYRAALDDLYGDAIERVVLFGSRARGDHRADSDYDVAVFLKQIPDRWEDSRSLAGLNVAFIDDTGVIFDTTLLSASSYRNRTPIMHEIRRDGRDL